MGVMKLKVAGLIVGLGLAFGMGYWLVRPGTCAGCEQVAGTVSVEEFKKLVGAGTAKLIDVRTPEEFSAGYIEGAVNSDFQKTAEFGEYLDSLDKSKPYLVYCRTGRRSGEALKLMRDKGFTNVADLGGGIAAWEAAGLAVVK